MTEGGLPLCHYVFPGHTTDQSTVQGVAEDVKKRFRIKDVIIVGDRGMLSGQNLDMITDEELRFIISHPLRERRALYKEEALLLPVPSKNKSVVSWKFRFRSIVILAAPGKCSHDS